MCQCSAWRLSCQGRTADANSVCHHGTQRFEHCESDKFSMQAVQNVEQERKLASEQQLQQKQARKAQLRDAHLKSIRRKALDETTKVKEVLFINKLQKEDKELTLMQRMQVITLSACPEPLMQQMHRLVVLHVTGSALRNAYVVHNRHG